MEKSAQKVFDRADIVRDVRLHSQNKGLNKHIENPRFVTKLGPPETTE
jgi:hypothetical protein